MAKKEAAQLIFEPGANEGFRNSSVSAYDNVDPVIIVRELIQNSLDAGRAVGRKVTEIAFTMDSMPTKEILGLEEYRQAFEAAVDYHEQKNNLILDSVEPIRDNLNKLSINALWIEDNGIGLDVKRMQRLLADGFSDTKDRKRGGSYGNGHITAFPSSDLRYIIYGGCNKNGEKIISGHTILACHEMQKGDLRGKDGHIKMRNQQDLFMADFPSDQNVPPYWQKRLAKIHNEYGTGSFVCILAFNDFKLHESDVENSVFYTAAAHFMPAIHEGGLKVSFNGKQLTQERLSEVTAQRKDEKRKKRNMVGYAGWKTHDIYQAINGENHKKVTLANGEKVSIYVLSSADLSDTHIHLYRNGMWITDELKHNERHDFNDFQAFCAVVVVEAGDAENLFKIIRDTEGPTHIGMNFAKLSDRKEKDFLEEALRKVREEIMNIAPKKEGESMDSDFITLGEGSIGSITPIHRRPVNPRANGGGGGGGGGKGKRKGVRTKSVSRSGNPFDASSTLSRDGDNLYVSFRAHENAQNIEVRIVHRSGSDLSCDNPEPDEFIAIAEGITLDDEIISKDYYIDDTKGTKAAFHIGAIEAGETEHKLVIPCVSLPSSGSLDVELVRRAKRGDSS